jgi:SlyX protein
MDHDDTERRIEALEIKAAFAEDLLDHLNAIVARQQDAIEMLVRELGRLREQQSSPQDAAARSLRDELPPHY